MDHFRAPIAAIIPTKMPAKRIMTILKTHFGLLMLIYLPVKYGIRDHRGGGRSSARETASRVVAGAIAKLLLKKYGVSIQAYVSKW
jgi:hypothetical protein